MQWRIPPLPQLVTIGHGIWTPGMQHFRRQFNLYDVIVVRSGCLYMKEEGREFAVGAGSILILEPGMVHEGYRQCEEETELIWFHIKHDSERLILSSEDVPWSMLLSKATDQDDTPKEEPLYLPKFGCYKIDEVWRVLKEMVRLHQSLTVGSALQLQAEFVRALVLLQGLVRGEQEGATSRLASAVVDYLRKHIDQPLQLATLEEIFHFNSDYIARCLKRHTGMSPLEYVRHIRINKACSLLEHAPELSIKQIGVRVGIEDSNYFIRQFRQEKGVTPAVYRRNRQGYA